MTGLIIVLLFIFMVADKNGLMHNAWLVKGEAGVNKSDTFKLRDVELQLTRFLFFLCREIGNKNPTNYWGKTLIINFY